MNKQEFIDKLKQHEEWCTECHDINGKKDRYVKGAKVRELLDQLDEPQDEKVVVPDFVADWFEGNKWNLEVNIWRVTIEICKKGEQTDFEKWVNDSGNKPFETLIKMKLFGYTVKPKRWVVKLPNDYYFSSWVSLYSLEADGAAYKFYDDVFVFDDRTKAEAVATLVDGIVDEV